MKQLFLIFLCSLSLYATECGPWLPPLWEFESRIGYGYSHTERVQSPSGSFKYNNNYHEVYGSLGMTVWPETNIEAELSFVKSETLPFSYEVFACTARRLLLDELAGDWISATIGVTVALPSARILKDFNYAYHGYFNSELHLALGKEFCHTCTMDWGWRLWGLIGMGIAERGSPWTHGLLVFDQALSRKLRLSLLLESLFGLGNQNIEPLQPFEGYASIHHQTVDLAAALHYDIGIYATFSFLGYINLYAHNFTQHTFGCNATLLIPFGL
jgi:hypothetical protein